MLEPLTALLTDHKLPVGRSAKLGFDWLKAHASPLFDAIAVALDRLIAGIQTVLEFPHPLVFTALAVALAWFLRRSWRTCVWVCVGFLFILNQGYWDATMQSLTLVLSACVVCMAVGVPAGIDAPVDQATDTLAIGVPFPGLDARIVDIATGEVVTDGTQALARATDGSFDLPLRHSGHAAGAATDAEPPLNC